MLIRGTNVEERPGSGAVRPKHDRLESWQEISGYVDRGVRTLQRWEAYGFPVHRTEDRQKGRVYALKSEIDQWLKSIPVLTARPSVRERVRPEILHAPHQRLTEKVGAFRQRCEQLQQNHNALAATLRRTAELQQHLQFRKA